MAAKQKLIYKGKVIDLNIEVARLPNGSCIELEIVRHPGGAAVVALDRHNQICLLRQFRHAAGRWLWELPAGKIDSTEDPIDTAKRELEEEAGVRAAAWDSLGRVISSPGVFTEVIHLYVASGLTHTAQRTEEHELIEVHWVPFESALTWANCGEIMDAKTLVGLFRAQKFLARVSHQGAPPLSDL